MPSTASDRVGHAAAQRGPDLHVLDEEQRQPAGRSRADHTSPRDPGHWNADERDRACCEHERADGDRDEREDDRAGGQVQALPQVDFVYAVLPQKNTMLDSPLLDGRISYQA